MIWVMTAGTIIVGFLVILAVFAIEILAALALLVGCGVLFLGLAYIFTKAWKYVEERWLQ